MSALFLSMHIAPNAKRFRALGQGRAVAGTSAATILGVSKAFGLRLAHGAFACGVDTRGGDTVFWGEYT